MTIFPTSRTKLTFGMVQCRPYNKEKLKEQFIYLDRRTVTKKVPAESSEGCLNRVVAPKKNYMYPLGKLQ